MRVSEKKGFTLVETLPRLCENAFPYSYLNQVMEDEKELFLGQRPISISPRMSCFAHS